MAKIKTFKQACKAIGVDPNAPAYTTGQPHIMAMQKLEVIAQALNEGWKPNWDNTNEVKYYPWFYMGSAGAGFRFGGYVYDYGRSYVGSRLVFKSRDLAAYAAQTFTAIYKDFFLA